MASFYGAAYPVGGNQNNSNESFQQYSSTQQQQPNFSQWQQPQQQSQGQNPPSFGEQGQTFEQYQPNQQQSVPQLFWTSNVQQAASQMAAGFVAQATTGNLTSDKVLSQGFDHMQKAFGGGMPGMDYIMRILRSYFAVDNRYVKGKILLILFPFRNKQWRRRQVEGPEIVNYALPHSDQNAPDLYLPVMSLITYCLLSAFLHGTAGQFNPDVIADVIWKCVITQVIEVLLCRGCLYAMQTSIPFLDLFSYTGYKYLGLTVCMLFGIIFKQFELGWFSFYGTFSWTASAAAWFMLKTMANNIPTQTSATGPKRDFVVIGFAASQVITMWFVSQTKYLS